MNRQEILEKAISKAIDGGWKPIGETDKPLVVKIIKVENSLATDYQVYAGTSNHELFFTGDYQKAIFNHEFAKSLWGEEEVEHTDNVYVPAYIEHLMQMVIAEDPIAYLGETLKETTE